MVTGGGTGMGRAVSELFGAEGATVIVNYRASADASRETAEGIVAGGGEAVAMKADVADESDVGAMIGEIDKRWGRLDVLVNNAGWSQLTPHADLDALTDEIWDRTLNTNLRGAFYAIRQAVPLLRRNGGGSIVNNTSASAWHAAGSSVIYSASKAAMVNMTKSLARALAPDIRVNGVAPGLIKTRFAGWPEAAFEKGAEATPLGRLATAEEVAKTVLFLAVDATGITAETILVDGGRTQLGPKQGR